MNTQHQKMLDRWGWKGRRQSEGFVYFLYSPALRRVKIGYSMKTPASRMRDLQVGSPDILVPVLVLRCEVRLESDLHERCDYARSHGEWFNWPAAARGFCEVLLLHGGPVSVEYCGTDEVSDHIYGLYCDPSIHGGRSLNDFSIKYPGEFRIARRIYEAKHQTICP